MRPESTSVVFREDLSALLQEYSASKAADRFIGRKASPIFGAPKAQAAYPVMNRENFKKPASTDRAADGSYNRITGQFGRATYDCEEHGLESVIDDRKRNLYSSLFDTEEAEAQMLMYQILMAHEQRVAAAYVAAGLTNHNTSADWSVVANGVPITDLLAGVDALQDKCGCAGSDLTLIIPRTDFREMMLTTQIINKTQYTYSGILPAELKPNQIAAMLGIGQVLVASGVYDSTEEGIAETNSQMWTAGIMYLVVLAPEGSSLATPSASRTVLWTGDSPELPVVETYRDDKIRADVVRVRDDTDEIMQGETDLFAYQLTNT